MNESNRRLMETAKPPMVQCIVACGIALLIFMGTMVSLFAAVVVFAGSVYFFDGGRCDENVKDRSVEEIVEGFGRREMKKKKKKEREEVMEEGRRSECWICLEEFEEGDKFVVFPVCNHLFHCHCIVSWLLENKRTCPVCRSSV